LVFLLLKEKQEEKKMPTYEYECKKCGYRFEKFQKMTEPPVEVCPECKEKKVKRLISAGSGVIYKGPGFYTTEYRSEEYKRKANEEKHAITSSSSSSCAGCSSSNCSTCKK